VFSPASQDVAGKSLQKQQQKQQQHSKNKPKRNAGGIIKFQVSTFPAQHPVAKNPEPNKYIYILYTFAADLKADRERLLLHKMVCRKLIK